jgi:hypothetical protein
VIMAYRLGTPIAAAHTPTSGTPQAAFGPILGLLIFICTVSQFVLFLTAWAATARPTRPADTVRAAAAARPDRGRR